MSKFNPKQLRADAPHKVMVKLTIRDEHGERQNVETPVFYRGLSLDQQADFPTVEGTEGKDRIEIVKQQLALLVHSLPDFGVGSGAEQAADAEFFGALEDATINAISEAIAEDRDPNVKPSNSSQPTTGAGGK